MKKDFTQPDDRCFGPVEISEGCPIPVAYQASAEDVEDSVLDPFGVRYSTDGTRLLGFEGRLPRRYAVKEGCRVICCCEDSDFTLSAEHCFDDLEDLVLPEGLIPLTTFRVPKGTAGQFERLVPPSASTTMIEY